MYGKPPGLVAWWPLDGNAEDIATESGTYSGVEIVGTTQAAGKAGSGLRFDGVDDHIKLPNAAFNSGSGITVVGWVSLDSTTGGDVFTSGDTVPCEDIILGVGKDRQGITSFNVPSYADDIYGFVAPANDQCTNFVPNGPIATPLSSGLQTGRFYHIALTADYAGSNLITLYVDGAPVVSKYFSGVQNSRSMPATIGMFRDGALNRGPLRAFAGVIDELAIFNRALSSGEIREIFDAQDKGMCRPNENTAPVFYAGYDQDVVNTSAPIQICRTVDAYGNPFTNGNECSFHDDDGDTAIQFEWRFKLNNGKPAGSVAAISNTSILSPTFVADMFGTYVLEGRAYDDKDWSAFDEVIISTEDLPPSITEIQVNPVTGVVGTSFSFCAISDDQNGSVTTHNWTIVAPNGQVSTQQNTGYCDLNQYSSFIGNQLGQYKLTLSVDDGTYPTPTTEDRFVVVTSIEDSITEKTKELIDYVTQLLPESFSNPKLVKPYSNKLNEILSLVDSGEYQLAYDKLTAMYKKSDDCTQSGGKPKDWFINCAEKEVINSIINELKVLLELLI